MESTRDNSLTEFLTSFADQNFIFRNVQPTSPLRKCIEEEIHQRTKCAQTTFLQGEIAQTRELDRAFIPALQTKFVEEVLSQITHICEGLTANRAKKFELIIDARQIPQAPDGNLFGDLILVGVRYLT